MFGLGHWELLIILFIILLIFGVGKLPEIIKRKDHEAVKQTTLIPYCDGVQGGYAGLKRQWIQVKNQSGRCEQRPVHSLYPGGIRNNVGFYLPGQPLVLGIGLNSIECQRRSNRFWGSWS